MKKPEGQGYALECMAKKSLDPLRTRMGCKGQRGVEVWNKKNKMSGKEALRVAIQQELPAQVCQKKTLSNAFNHSNLKVLGLVL
jgi:hypothetical protein